MKTDIVLMAGVLGVAWAAAGGEKWAVVESYFPNEGGLYMVSGDAKPEGANAWFEPQSGKLTYFSGREIEDYLTVRYGIPYRPYIWGAGWDIQRFGFETYFLHRAFPELFPADLVYNALNFVLGCHPGSNTASFASGVGARSATTAYGANRGDWSYIPGGVISGTALIRPDFPELLEFPFLWQQAEYVLGGGSSNYMFLVLAAKQLAEGK